MFGSTCGRFESDMDSLCVQAEILGLSANIFDVAPKNYTDNSSKITHFVVY